LGGGVPGLRGGCGRVHGYVHDPRDPVPVIRPAPVTGFETRTLLSEGATRTPGRRSRRA
jgi:hypothetical protein